MKCCVDLYTLSTIACKLTDCLSPEEAAFLATELTTLGDMITVLLAKEVLCVDSCESNH